MGWKDPNVFQGGISLVQAGATVGTGAVQSAFWMGYGHGEIDPKQIGSNQVGLGISIDALFGVSLVTWTSGYHRPGKVPLWEYGIPANPKDWVRLLTGH
jgi:hypothetical protein